MNVLPFDVLTLLFYFVFASLLVVIFAYDLAYTLIPDFATIGIALLGVIEWASKLTTDTLYVTDLGATLAVTVLVLLLFGGIWYISKGRAMGFGDVKLAPVLVFFLGAVKGLLAVLLSFWLGALFGIFFILMRKASFKSQIPFGPYLALGAFISLLWGDYLMASYFQLLGV